MRFIALFLLLVSCAHQETSSPLFTTSEQVYQKDGCYFAEELISLRLLKDFSQEKKLNALIRLQYDDNVKKEEMNPKNYRIPVSVPDSQLGDNYLLKGEQRIFQVQAPRNLSLEKDGQLLEQGKIKWQVVAENWQTVNEEKRISLAREKFAFDEYQDLKYQGKDLILIAKRYRLCSKKRHTEIKKVMENRLARNAFVGQESSKKLSLQFLKGDESLLEVQKPHASLVVELTFAGKALGRSLDLKLKEWKKTHHFYDINKQKWLMVPKQFAKKGRFFIRPHEEVPWAFRFRLKGSKFWVLAPVKNIQAQSFLAWLKREKRSYILIEESLAPDEELYSYEHLQPLIYYNFKHNLKTTQRGPAAFTGPRKLWVLEGKKNHSSPFLQKSPFGGWSLIFP